MITSISLTLHVFQQSVSIKGLAQIKTLIGSAEVFGFILEANHGPVEIFSPSTSSLVTVSECSKGDSSNRTNLKTTLQDALQNQPSDVIKKILARAKKAAVVLLISSLQSVEMNFVCSFQSFQDIFSLDLGKVQWLLLKVFIFPKKYSNITDGMKVFVIFGYLCKFCQKKLFINPKNILHNTCKST